MHSSKVFLLIFCFALCKATQHFQLDQKVFETLPRLPKSFSDEEWTRVQTAIQNSIDCKESHLSWNQTADFELDSFGYPNCVLEETRQKATLQKAGELKSCSKIPKIIHQQWQNETVPEKWTEFHEGWKEKNPDWVVLLWTDQDKIEWIKTNYDWFIEIYRNFPYDIERADAFRYFLLWSYGGVYVDLDYECKTPLSDYMSEIQKPIGLVSPQDGEFSNSMIFSVPKHDLWGTALEQIYQNPSYFFAVTKNQHIAYTTGPKFLQTIISTTDYGQDICSLQKTLFHPCSACESSEQCQATCEAENCFASQHNSDDWTDFPNNVFHLGSCNAQSTAVAVLELVVPSAFILTLGLCLKRKWYRRRKELKRRIQHAC